MVKRTGGGRRKTRSKYRKNKDEKGKISIRRYLQQFQSGDRVVLKLEPSVHRGMYFRRFHGKSGTVMSKRGSCYEISIKDGYKQKTVVVHPVHLIKQ